MAVVYHHCLSPKEYAGVPTSRLHSESCTIRTKTAANHTPTIAPQATSRQCRGAQAEHFVQRLSMTDVAMQNSRTLGYRINGRSPNLTYRDAVTERKALVAGGGEEPTSEVSDPAIALSALALV
jgi:hypothetical protein